MKLPRSFGGRSFLHIHLSPINYLPNALSYLIPIDRMTWFGLTYGILDGLLLLAVFACLYSLFGARVLLTFAGTMLFYCSGLITVGQFEPHQEYASALFMVGFFVAWALDRWPWAVAMLLLNATVREDCGALLAFPLFLLAVWYLVVRAPHRRDARHDPLVRTGADFRAAFGRGHRRQASVFPSF